MSTLLKSVFGAVLTVLYVGCFSNAFAFDGEKEVPFDYLMQQEFETCSQNKGFSLKNIDQLQSKVKDKNSYVFYVLNSIRGVGSLAVRAKTDDMKLICSESKTLGDFFKNTITKKWLKEGLKVTRNSTEREILQKLIDY